MDYRVAAMLVRKANQYLCRQATLVLDQNLSICPHLLERDAYTVVRNLPYLLHSAARLGLWSRREKPLQWMEESPTKMGLPD